MKKILLLLTTACLFIISSCEKEGASLNVPDIDRITFEQIGIQHNFALKQALQNAPSNLSKINVRDFSYEQIKIALPLAYDIYEQQENITDQNFERTLMSSNPDYNLYIEQNDDLSAPLKKYLLRMNEIILKNVSVGEVKIQLDRLENQADKELTYEDLIIFFSSTSVAKYSAKFWSPESKGGDNGMKYLGKGNVELRKLNWGSIIVSDAIGIVSGAAKSVIQTGGLAAAPNPAFGGLPTASVVGLVSGVSASAVTGARQWFGD